MTDEAETDLLEPRENPNLLGHAEAEGVLLDAYRSGRLAHAWLISGPRGIGKATLAYRFARFVLAGGQSGDGLNLAPDHRVFRRVAAAGHSDLYTLERKADEKTGKVKTVIGVDDVRAAGRFFTLTAGEGGWRVCVVDCADELNRSSANALLKVLEEPPARALLLLVSHTPARLLPTIRSRCRKLILQPLATDAVAGLLRAHDPELETGDALALAALADGSPGRAFQLLSGGGLEIYRDMTALLASLPGLDVARLHAFGQKLARPGADDAFETATDLLRGWLARMIVARAGGADGAGDGADPDQEALMARLGPAAGLDRWLEVWEKINHLVARAGAVNLDRKQVVLNAFLAIEDTVRP